MSFRITGLPADSFRHLFELSDEELATHRALRCTVDKENSFPCRVSLTDAAPGDEVLLVNYEHHPVETPYRSSFAVYVRKGEETYDAVDEVPEQLRKRMLAVRAFDANAMVVGHELVDGRELESAIERHFANPASSYLHIHFASPGCYAARIDRG